MTFDHESVQTVHVYVPGLRRATHLLMTDLHRATELEMKDFAAVQSIWQDLPRKKKFSQRIRALACSARGVAAIAEGEVLPTFLSSEAIALLNTLPNLYFFWAVVQMASHWSEDHKPIDRAAVEQAISGLRNRWAETFDLRKPVDKLSAEELKLRVAAGIFVLKAKRGQSASNALLVANSIASFKARRRSR